MIQLFKDGSYSGPEDFGSGETVLRGPFSRVVPGSLSNVDGGGCTKGSERMSSSSSSCWSSDSGSSNIPSGRMGSVQFGCRVGGASLDLVSLERALEFLGSWAKGH
jgi:hypothetical protein